MGTEVEHAGGSGSLSHPPASQVLGQHLDPIQLHLLPIPLPAVRLAHWLLPTGPLPMP